MKLLSEMPLHPVFFFNATTTTEIYTLSLHDALPILFAPGAFMTATPRRVAACTSMVSTPIPARGEDRKSTRLNSSHVKISYAVFCLKKKKKKLWPTGTDRYPGKSSHQQGPNDSAESE